MDKKDTRFVKFRGGYFYVPGSTKNKDDCDKFGLFYDDSNDCMANGQSGDSMEILMGLADKDKRTSWRQPKKQPNGNPCEIVIKGLPVNMDEKAVADHFQTYGRIVNILLPLDQITGNSRGNCIIRYSEPLEAELAVYFGDNTWPFKGKGDLIINYARPDEFQYLSQAQFEGGIDEDRFLENINEQAIGKIATKTYEDFMLHSRSASPEGSPRREMNSRRTHWNSLAQVPDDGNVRAGVGATIPSRRRPNEPRLFEEGVDGEVPVDNQEMVEGLIGAPKGMLMNMFTADREGEERHREMTEGLASGFDGVEGMDFEEEVEKPDEKEGMSADSGDEMARARQADKELNPLANLPDVPIDQQNANYDDDAAYSKPGDLNEEERRAQAARDKLFGFPSEGVPDRAGGEQGDGTNQW